MINITSEIFEANREPNSKVTWKKIHGKVKIGGELETLGTMSRRSARLRVTGSLQPRVHEVSQRRREDLNVKDALGEISEILEPKCTTIFGS